jgi:hypothetical protein
MKVVIGQLTNNSNMVPVFLASGFPVFFYFFDRFDSNFFIFSGSIQSRMFLFLWLISDAK